MKTIGLVLDPKFHLNGNWVSALTKFLVNEIIDVFRPQIIDNQKEYEKHKRFLKTIISMSPGWSCPFIKFDTHINCKKFVFHSDPHNRPDFFAKYFIKNKFNGILSYYLSPFLYHFSKDFPIPVYHFPWAIPDQFIHAPVGALKGIKSVSIFGGAKSAAYDFRNKCRQFTGVESFDNSGVENKMYSDYEYFDWLTQKKAVIAAGSTNPMYNLVTPKYFEIPASGALLFAQDCPDLEQLGFSDENCVIITPENTEFKIQSFLSKPKTYENIRHAGFQLIKERHSLSTRISYLKKIIAGEIHDNSF